MKQPELPEIGDKTDVAQRRLRVAKENLQAANLLLEANSYRGAMSPVYREAGIENTVNHNSLSNVLKQDETRFSMQIANAKAVLNSIGSSVNISV